MLEVMLRGYDLVHGMDGCEGLERLAEHADIDLVLLDINMPNMNGLEFLEKVRADPALERLPVVIVSIEGGAKDIERGLAAGANGYVSKPFRAEDIQAQLSRLAAEGSAAGA